MSRLAKYLQPLAVVGALTMIPLSASTLAAADADTMRELDTFMDVFNQVRANYVDKVDDHVLVKGAIEGMLAALDPHSSYMEGSDYTSLKTTTDGNYGGLGLSVTMEDGAVKVITPTEDTPADKAGMKAGDYITHIDGQLLYGLELDEAVEKMRGAPGTKITLTVVRRGRDKPFDVTITRAKIELRVVKWEIKDNVGIININSFAGNTGQATEAALTAIDKATGGRPTGYIIDLRSNPGGLLNEAVRVSDAFLDRGEIVSERGREKSNFESWSAKPGDMAHGLPVIVLVDVGSASAAEIVAGALQDHRRAIVMGERTFGKGSVQGVQEISATRALRLTIARYYTPSGRSVQAGGIDPDIVVPQLSDPDYKDRPAIREADLRRHLVSQTGVKDEVLEKDNTPDPRFSATAEELKKKGIKDFQLDYAIRTLKRLAPAAPSAPAKAR
ncbi:S41 family peptidase [Sphingomonas sp.]|uniref:S41 family peptidase n=1 Tax=Sphingomonas sp. TaxID=28214 RepID=UPI00286A2C3A|nr:S41 family peptidase [Sphingomonas sp.]